MFKSLLKYILPSFIINLILKFYIKLIRIKSFKTSQSFWNENTVSSPQNGFNSVSESLKHLKWRNNQYIDSDKNMNFRNTHKKIVLDYGCGPGNGLINIMKSGCPKRIYAVDVSKKSIYLAKKRAELHKLSVNFHHINENEVMRNIERNSVDVIKCDGVLHHIDNMGFVFKEFKRVLKRNGVINLMIYNKQSLWFHLHVNYELMIKRNVFPNLLAEEVFKISTDGFQCPVSKCFSPKEFIKISRNYHFNAKLINISISRFELSKIKLIKEAVESKKIDRESKSFLEKLSFKENNIPYIGKNIAGINAYYELRNL